MSDSPLARKVDREAVHIFRARYWARVTSNWKDYLRVFDEALNNNESELHKWVPIMQRTEMQW